MEAPVDGGGGSLHVALEDLRSFKTRVDGLLEELDGSDFAPKEIGQGRVKAVQIGHGFGEAEDLMKAYDYVHGQLEQLSLTLANQIEAMSLSLHIGHSTFKNVDLGTQRKLLDLNDQIVQAYNPALDPNAPKVADTGHPAAHTAADHGGSGSQAGSGGVG
ncbi:hypothetical protein [Actinacidiphila paucisporea]|uniref:Uncharacterized protein n=1 Tax=Actinacidiphila paucisporea TaxID=310782 RepID=A0A1M7KLY1_9ACTN|nr:hypothetical protein [Actinacidiphila paucisporea]SHM66366.1 hypothetical protein SAMN05216499_11324 [Actinacidiphila paucisporea]